MQAVSGNARDQSLTVLRPCFGVCRRRAVDKSDAEDDDADAMDEDDQYDEHEGDNEPEGQAASSGNHAEHSGILDVPLSKQDEATQEVQRQRNLEQALHIQMEMQKKLHEQLEVCLTECMSMLLCQACHKICMSPSRPPIPVC